MLKIFRNYIPDGTNQGVCIFFLFGRAGAVARNHVAFAYTIKCHRAVGLSALIILV